MTRKRTSENDLVVSAAGATAPARRKGSARPRPTRAPEPLTPAAPPAAELETVAPQALAPSYDDVAKLAYSYWEARGCQGGCPEEDWVRAEQELGLHATAATA